MILCWDVRATEWILKNISMKQKIISWLFLLLFFIVFWYFFGDSYWQFQTAQKSQEYFQKQIAQNTAEFSLESLPLVGEETQLFVTPNLQLLDTLISQMDAANEKIYVEVYIFTEKRMREALIRAHDRGVEVKVLLENNPYQATSLNDDTYALLEKAGIDVRWSDPLNYSLNHSKLLIIDDITYISTGNFSYSLFKNNRDFLLQLWKWEVSEKLSELFFLDYTHELSWVFQKNLVISPYNSRQKIEFLLRHAEKTIDFYFPYIQDTWLENILFEKSQSWVKIRGIVEEAFYKENTELIKKYADKKIVLTPLTSSKLHGKILVVDEKYMYLGSINFSSYSMDENREMGIILKESSLISQMQKIFSSDL